MNVLYIVCIQTLLVKLSCKTVNLVNMLEICHNKTVDINVIAMEINNERRMQLVTESHGLCY